jgi:hypothetical protein
MKILGSSGFYLVDHAFDISKQSPFLWWTKHYSRVLYYVIGLVVVVELSRMFVFVG